MAASSASAWAAAAFTGLMLLVLGCGDDGGQNEGGGGDRGVDVEVASDPVDDSELPTVCRAEEAPIPASAPGVALEPPYLYEHPEPGGTFAVGTHLWSLTDTQRLDPFATDGPVDRQLIIQLYYPTEVRDGMPGALTSDEVAEVLVGSGLPPGFHTHIETASQYDVAPARAAGGWPLVLYTHAMGGLGWENQLLCEALASHGMVVAALSHPGWSAVVRLPSGEVVDGMGLPEVPETTDPESLITYHEAIAQLLREVIQPDLAFALQQLIDANESEPCSWLSGLLDTQRVAVIGLLEGGSAAYHFCRDEARCRGMIDLDGSLMGVDEPGEHTPPLLIVQRSRCDPSLDAARGSPVGTVDTLRIDETTSANFSMLAVVLRAIFPSFPASSLGIGTIDPEEAFTWYRDVVLAFLEHVFDGGATTGMVWPPLNAPEVLAEHGVEGHSSPPLAAFGRVMANWAHLIPAAEIPLGLLDGASLLTDEEGRWRVQPIPADGPIAFEARGEDLFPILIDLLPTGRHLCSPVFALPLTRHLEDITTSAGVPMDPERGHVVVYGECLHDRSLCGVQEGLTLADAAAQGTTVYLDARWAIDLDSTATRADRGVALLLNMEPGSATIEMRGPGQRCWAYGGRPGDDTVDVLIRPGMLTSLVVYCEH